MILFTVMILNKRSKNMKNQAGLFDEEENRLFKNTETNGRFILTGAV